MTYHSDEISGSVHIPYNWTYTSATAREAESEAVTADIGKLARQLDNNTIWMLTATAPTWVQFGGGGVPHNPAVNYKISDHFIGADLNRDVWTEAKSGGANNAVTAIEARGGAVQIDSHGATDDWCELTTSIKSFYAADNLVMTSGQKLEHTSDCSVFIGFRDDVNNRIEFQANTSSGYWDCLTTLSGSTTASSSVLALDTDWHHFRIEAGASEVKFYIDGTLRATHTTNIPTTIMDVISQTYTTGGTATRSHLCDYIDVIGDVNY